MFDIRVDRLLTSIEAASAGAEAFGRSQSAISASGS